MIYVAVLSILLFAGLCLYTIRQAERDRIEWAKRCDWLIGLAQPAAPTPPSLREVPTKPSERELDEYDQVGTVSFGRAD